MSDRPASHLFYQTRQRRPTLDRADGVYMWDTGGKRYLDGSSGAMVCNIGHSNPRVLDAMREQPGMLAGLEVPFSLESLLNDEEGAKEFARNAQKTLQK